MTPSLTLRIDVDFPQLAADTLPPMLEELERFGMKATFFIAAAASRPGSLLRRMRNASYIRRILRLGSGRSLLKMLFAMNVFNGAAPELAALVRRIEQAGHEIAVHGYDHVWWADRVWTAPPEDLAGQIEKAYACFHSVTETDGLAWASPGWRSTGPVIKLLEDRGVPYFAECWGREPFLTQLEDGTVIRTPHLPITLPCMESLRITERLGPEEAAQKILGLLKPGVYNMLCAHDYFEGLLGRGYFTAFLEHCSARAISTETVKAIACRLHTDLPVCRLGRGHIPGFEGQVSVQGDTA